MARLYGYNFNQIMCVWIGTYNYRQLEKKSAENLLHVIIRTLEFFYFIAA
jgi:hypothetical protein